MKDWQIILSVLAGVLFLRFIFRERFQDSPTGVRGPPYSDADVIKMLDLNLSKSDDDAASSAFVKGYRKYINDLRRTNSTIEPADIRTENGRAKIFNIVKPYFERFYNNVYSPATTPITEQQVRASVDANLPTTRPAWLNAEQVENLKKLMKKYFVDQPPGPVNAPTTEAQRRAATHVDTSGFGYGDVLRDLGQNPYNATQASIISEMKRGPTGSTGTSSSGGGTTTSTTTTTSSGGATGGTQQNVVNVNDYFNNPTSNNLYTKALEKVGNLKNELITLEKQIANNNLQSVKGIITPPNTTPVYDSWDVVAKERLLVASFLQGDALWENRTPTEAEFSANMMSLRNDAQSFSIPPNWFTLIEKLGRKIAGLPDKTSSSSGGATGSFSGNLNTTTGGSTTSSWGPSGDSTGGRGFNVFGPEFAGVGQSSYTSGMMLDSTKTTDYPELLGPSMAGKKTRVDGVGMINPSVNAPGMNVNLPDFNTLGRSLMPGDRDPYRVAQTFSPSSYSSRGTEPVPFLTDFSAFLK